MVSIEPVSEVCKKEFYWQVEIPSAIADYYPKLFGLTIIIPDLVFMGT